MKCRICFEQVETYEPTGTRGRLRAVLHNSPAMIGRQVCSGSYGPVDDEATVEREKRRVQAWYGEVPQTADIND